VEIRFIPGRGFDSNVYLVIGKSSTIIDAGMGLHHDYILGKIEKYLDPEEVEQIVLTHEHIDHSRGVKKLLEDMGKDTTVLAHEYAAEKLEKEGNRISTFFGVFVPSLRIDKKVKDKDRIILGDDEFVVLHTPGHAPGSICLYNEVKGILFSGDTVFSHGDFGRYDLEGGDPALLLESLERLASLDVKDLYPGHGEIVIGDGAKHIKLALRRINDTRYTQ
jgi:glyoxylase-like metal-dependent hydrolase (beta-lactamase superfamily II)